VSADFVHYQKLFLILSKKCNMSNQREKIEYLDSLFSINRKYTRAELEERFEAKFNQPLKRVFFDYLKILKEEEKAPLKREHDKTKFGQTRYFYDAPFSLNKRLLKIEDVQKLKTALAILKQVEGFPQTGDFTALIATIESQTNLRTVDNQPIVLLDHRPSSQGIRWIDKLCQFIEKKVVLEIVYRPFREDKLDQARLQGEKVYLHPYFLKESQRYWYLFGWNEQNQKIENYELARIMSVKAASGYGFRPAQMDLSAYFDDIYGVTKFEKEEMQLYRLRVSKTIAPYWKTRCLHTSQKEVMEDEKGVIFEFKLRWNYEWQNLILHYGKNVEVLEPIGFRMSIQQILKESLALYEGEVTF
jgi:predicted DNA-binding transcriptional regulator YafY